MDKDRRERRVEAIDNSINTVAEIIPYKGKQRNRQLKEMDAKIVQHFPVFVGVCIAFWIFAIFFMEEFTLQNIIKILCVVFIAGFTVIGAPIFFLMADGVFPKWILLVDAALFSGIAALYGHLTGHALFQQAVGVFLAKAGIVLDGFGLAMTSWLIMMLIILFAIIGVMYVLSAYLRKFFPRVFLGLYIHSRQGIRAGTEKFFAIPDIIDVKDVILDPSIDRSRYNTPVALKLAIYIVLCGLLVSSYLFLNPVFLETMSTEDMSAIMVMLSVFLPTLIVPWQIVADLNARVVSDAPRDYYLWTGAKKTLMGFFLALAVFLTMFLIALSYGHSVWDMLLNYAYYLVPLICISQMFAMVYANNFVEDMKEQITADFQEGKAAADE